MWLSMAVIVDVDIRYFDLFFIAIRFRFTSDPGVKYGAISYSLI